MLLKNKVLFDTSCFMASIRRERGYEVIDELLYIAVASMVSLSELVATLINHAIFPSVPEAVRIASGIAQVTIPFTQEVASLAGKLVQYTKPFGLSLGDRACIATGIVHKLPIYTCDKIWTKLDLDCDIRLIR